MAADGFAALVPRPRLRVFGTRVLVEPLVDPRQAIGESRRGFIALSAQREDADEAREQHRNKQQQPAAEAGHEEESSRADKDERAQRGVSQESHSGSRVTARSLVFARGSGPLVRLMYLLELRSVAGYLPGFCRALRVDPWL